MEPKSYSRYLLTALCISVVFTTLSLVAINAWLSQQSIETDETASFSDEQSQQAYRDGYLAARKRLTDAGLCLPIGETRSLTATVNSVGSDRIIVTQRSLDTDPIADGVSDERTVFITAETKIYFETPKSSDQIAKTPLSPFTRNEAIWTDIPQENGLVRVSAADDVRLKDEFVATEIVILGTKK
jgi:hypothetical protein